MPASDPRVFFAAERTLLAWLRTGIAIVGLGFVVSRFGLFLHLVAFQSPGGSARLESLSSSVLGIVFVAIGAIAVGVATLQHGRFIATLPEVDRPSSYSRQWALWLSVLVSLASFLLAAYLAVTLP